MVFIVILLLILLNGYFSLAEIALVAVKKGQLEAAAEKGSKGAVQALRLSNDPEGFLSAVQVGITLLGLLEGIYGGDMVATWLAPILVKAGVTEWLAHGLSLVLGIGLITYFTIVIGELLPKSIALQVPLKVSLAIAPSLVLFSKIAYPFIRMLTWSTRILLRAFKVKTQDQEQVSEQDLLRMLSTAQQQGVLEKEELWLHQNVFAFGDLTAGRMMKPLTLVRCLNERWTREEVISLMQQYPYTHFPVYRDEVTNVMGILSAKAFFLNRKDRWQGCIHKGLQVPETMVAKEVFRRLNEVRSDFALVTDETQQVSGILTMQDIMEGVFGDIPELETYSDYFYKLGAHEWQAHGFIHLQRIRRVLGLQWLRDYETTYLSIQELLEGELGHLPAEGETLTLHDVAFRVVAADAETVSEVIIHLP